MNINDLASIPTGGKYCEKCGQWISLAPPGNKCLCEFTTIHKENNLSVDELSKIFGGITNIPLGGNK